LLAFYHLFTAGGLECGRDYSRQQKFYSYHLPEQCAILSGWRRISCCHINVCNAADFALAVVSAPPAEMAHGQSAPRYITAVVGYWRMPCPIIYAGSAWLTPPPLAAIRAGFVHNDFYRALIFTIQIW